MITALSIADDDGWVRASTDRRPWSGAIVTQTSVVRCRAAGDDGDGVPLAPAEVLLARVDLTQIELRSPALRTVYLAGEFGA